MQAGDVSGRVDDIGFMQTKVQGFDGVPVLVPNQAFTSQVCHLHYQHLKFDIIIVKLDMFSKFDLVVNSILWVHMAIHFQYETCESSGIS